MPVRVYTAPWTLPGAPHVYQKVVLENGLVRLSCLPQLGGRIIEYVLTKDGRNRLYENTIWRPTKWGVNACRPEGGWKAIGGIEFSFPLCEHGCVHDRPFDYRLDLSDLSSTARLRLACPASVETRGLRLTIDVTLESDAESFRIDSHIDNPITNGGQEIQYWINAMLAPGGRDPRDGAIEFVFPEDVREMRMHGWTGPAGWTTAVPGALFAWPSRFSRYDDFHANGTVGFFAAAPVPFHGVFSRSAREGLLRLFRTPQGAKVFALGADENATHSDRDRPYIELWSGATPDFWTDLSIAPGQQLSFAEQWVPFWADDERRARERIAALAREIRPRLASDVN